MVGSLPFNTPSLHVGAAQCSVPRVHTRLVQSFVTKQPALSAHAGQLPPQSTSVSLPFSIPSPQLVAWHVPFEQATLSQSSLVAQCWSVTQRAHPVLPPQSMSVSSWFSMPSRHDCGRHFPFVHSVRSQSAATLQFLPLAQG
jgi:hypothetical protein